VSRSRRWPIVFGLVLLGWTLFTTDPEAASGETSVAASVEISSSETASDRETKSSGTQFSAEVSVGYVLVPVTVHNRRGFVADLALEDFDVTVDGREIEIDSFSLETSAPLDLLFLQDVSGSMAIGGKIGYSRRLLRCLVGGSQAHDTFGLAMFGNGRFWVSVPPASKGPELVQASLGYKPLGTTALHDAVSWIPELGRSGAGGRAAVIITDGVDNASRVSPEAAKRLLEDAAIPIYTIDLHSARDVVELADPVDSEKIERLLRGFAEVSGGRYIPAAPDSAAEPVCETIRDDLRRHYLLGFPTRGRSPRQHDIDVRVGGRKARKMALKFRRSYVGGDPAT